MKMGQVKDQGFLHNNYSTSLILFKALNQKAHATVDQPQVFGRHFTRMTERIGI